MQEGTERLREADSWAYSTFTDWVPSVDKVTRLGRYTLHPPRIKVIRLSESCSFSGMAIRHDLLRALFHRPSRLQR